MRARLIGNFLGSLRLAVCLFILIAVASLLGAVLVQRAPSELYLTRYGSFWGHLVLLAGLDDVFHSFWYGALLLLLALNILVCTLTRLKGTCRTAFGRSFRDEARVRNLRPFREIELECPPGEAKDLLIRGLRKRFYRTHAQEVSSESGTGYRLFASKGGVSSLGPTLVHFSILFVLIGGAWAGMRGFRYDRVLRSGETFTVPEGEFEVGLESFSIERSEAGRIKQYKSQVTIREGGEVVTEKTVMVNHPLLYKGVYIYQSGYGSEPRVLTRAKFSLTDRRGEFPAITFDVPFGQRTPIPSTDLDMEILDFVPDFLMDSHGVVTTRSEEHRNPACKVKLFRGDSVEMEGWRFLNFPQVHELPGDRYHVALLEYAPRYYTVLQVARTPGLTFIYASFVLAGIGLSLSFYLSHRKVWASIVSGGEGKANVLIGGYSRRNESGLEKELDLIVNLLKGWV